MSPVTPANISSKPSRQFSVDALRVLVYPDPKTLSQEAAAQAATHLRDTLALQETASVILATGQSQLTFLDCLLASQNLDWSRVILFHMDEYLGLPASHPASFHHYLHQRVESRIHCRAMHYLDGSTLEPLAECRRYAELLKSNPLDLCFLGVGENGHLAFNDPPVANFDDPDPVKIVKLDDICRLQQVKQGHFPTLESVPPYAITITIPTLCAAQKILCLAQGHRKGGIVRQMLQGPIEPACPASILRKQPQAILFLDQDAASSLA